MMISAGDGQEQVGCDDPSVGEFDDPRHPVYPFSKEASQVAC